MRIVCFLTILSFACALQAETIVLRDRSEISGQITKKDDKGVWIKLEGLTDAIFFSYGKLDPKHGPNADKEKEAPVETEKPAVVKEEPKEKKAPMTGEVELPGMKVEKPKAKLPHYTINTTVVTLNNQKEVYGEIVEDNEENVLLNTLMGQMRLSKDNIDKINEKEIPAEFVVKSNDLYSWVIKNHAPKSAEDHLDIARSMAVIGQNREALLHYQHVKINGMMAQGDIDKEIKQLKEGLALSDLDDPLATIKHLIGAKQYSKAIRILTNKLEGAEDGPAKDRISALLEKAKATLAATIDEDVVRLYHRKFELKLLGQASDRDASFAEGLAYIQVGLIEEIESEIQMDLGVSREKISDLWKSREKKGLGKSVCYFDGSWLADHVDSIGDSNMEKAELPEGEMDEEQLKKYKKARKAFIDSAVKEAAESIKGDVGEDEEEGDKKADNPKKSLKGFWSRSKTKTKSDILRALAAEKHMSVKKIEKKKCSNCNGSGKKGRGEPEEAGGKPTKKECSLCRGDGSYRVVVYQ